MCKKSFTIWMMSLFLALVFQIPVWAGYPEKPLNIMTWTNPGSTSDLMSRFLATIMEKSFGQPIQVVNKTGGTGIVAMSYLQSKPADGTWCLANSNSMIASLHDNPQSFNLDSFHYLIGVASTPEYIGVRKESPYKTIEEFLQAAKQKPGELKIGGSMGIGGLAWLTAKHIEKVANVKLNYIPYPGGHEPVVAVLGGHIDAVINGMAPLLGVFKSGDLRLLASTSIEPETDLKIPTFIEKNLMNRDENLTVTRGYALKKGTSPEIIEKLHSTFKKAIFTPEWKEFLVKYDLRPWYKTSAEFTKAMKVEQEITIPLLQWIQKSK